MPKLITDAVETATIGASSKAAQAGGLFTAVFGFLHANALALCGLAIAFLGLAVNAYFQKRRDAREERLAQRQLEKWRTQPSPLEGTPHEL